MEKLFGTISIYVRRWTSQFRIVPAIFTLGALIGVMVQAIAPYMRATEGSWMRLDSWVKAGRNGALVLGFTLYLRYEEKFRRYLKQRRLSHPWKLRMSELEMVVDRVAELDPERRCPKIQSLREVILRCIASGVAETLQLPQETLCANLLVLPDGQTRPAIPAGRVKRLIVKARSDPRRRVPVDYTAVDGFLPWRAIKNASMQVEDTYKTREGMEAREYKSIIAIPITKKSGEAYGSLSIDCTIAYAFNGRKEHVYYQVRPYLSLLALTFGPMDSYTECYFNPTHFK